LRNLETLPEAGVESQRQPVRLFSGDRIEDLHVRSQPVVAYAAIDIHRPYYNDLVESLDNPHRASVTMDQPPLSGFN
jgi:hypothetical protein